MSFIWTCLARNLSVVSRSSLSTALYRLSSVFINSQVFCFVSLANNDRSTLATRQPFTQWCFRLLYLFRRVPLWYLQLLLTLWISLSKNHCLFLSRYLIRFRSCFHPGHCSFWLLRTDGSFIWSYQRTSIHFHESGGFLYFPWHLSEAHSCKQSVYLRA